MKEKEEEKQSERPSVCVCVCVCVCVNRYIYILTAVRAEGVTVIWNLEWLGALAGTRNSSMGPP